MIGWKQKRGGARLGTETQCGETHLLRRGLQVFFEVRDLFLRQGGLLFEKLHGLPPLLDIVRALPRPGGVRRVVHGTELPGGDNEGVVTEALPRVTAETCARAGVRTCSVRRRFMSYWRSHFSSMAMMYHRCRRVISGTR